MMKTSLSHLPEDKQAHLATLLEIIHDEFDQVVSAATKEEKKRSRILLVILFGSHATGSWVKDYENGFISDYDILVVLNEPALSEDYKIWHTVEERAALKTKTPVNLMTCPLRTINQELKQGHYFFKDIRQQGIQLYQYNHTELIVPGKLNAEEAREAARKHFDHWYTGASEFLIDYQHAFDRKSFNNAAFHLHQAVERYLSCLVLVYTNYRPKTHNLLLLRSLASQQADDIKPLFPQDKQFNRRSLQRLKKAYIEARYSEHYEIASEELAWLASETEKLKAIVGKLCDKIISRS